MNPDNNPNQNSPKENPENRLDDSYGNNQSETATTPLAETQPQVPSSAAQTPSDGSVISSHKSHKSRKYILILLIIILLGVAILAAIKVINNSNAPGGKHYVSLITFGTTEPINTTVWPNMGTDSVSQEVQIEAFEGLTKFVNETQVVPNLATSWTNPNDTTWIFQLRQGVKFHDGRTMTSTQVAASLNQVKNYPIAQGDVPYTIKTAIPDGNYAVKIVTTQPDPILDKELTDFWIWDTSNMKSHNSIVNGTGPYELKPGTKYSTNSVQYVTYDNYWGAKPTVKNIDFNYYKTPQSLIEAIKQNKVSLADLTNQYAYTGQATAAGYKLFNVLNPAVYYIIPNTLKAGSPIQNLKVRQAIYMTLDPKLIAKAHNGDVGTPADQLVTAQIPGYNSSIQRPAINITEAKALLAQAGYPNGFTLSFTYFSPNVNGVATEIQKELAAIGIKLTLVPVTNGDTYYTDLSNPTGDLYFYGDSTVIVDSSDVIAYTVVNSPEFNNSQIDDFFNQAQQTFNQTNRLKLLQRVDAYAMNDLAVLPIYTPTNQYIAYNPNLHLAFSQQYIGGIDGIYYSQVYSTKLSF